jgi:uncharacterized MnhB-related membrane protein
MKYCTLLIMVSLWMVVQVNLLSAMLLKWMASRSMTITFVNKFIIHLRDKPVDCSD